MKRSSFLLWAIGSVALLSARDAGAVPFVFQLEGGTIAKQDTYVNPTWDVVALKYSYENPVILAIPNTNGNNPADFRVRNVGKTSFEVTLTEPPSEDGPHVAMSVSYVAVETGKWSLPDGRRIAAGFVDTNQTVWSGGGGFLQVKLPVGFFKQTPLVFTQIQGLANELNKPPSQVSNPWLTTAVRNVNAASFDLALDGCECTKGNVPKAEHVGWLAIESGNASSFVDSDMKPVSYETILTKPLVTGWDNGGATIPFVQNYLNAPLFIARLQARTDQDGGWPRYANLGKKSVALLVDEDRCQDTERVHSPEPAALFVFSQSFRVQDADPDKDGLASSVDNCPLDYNPMQQDANMNGIGDACDCGDGLIAAIEECDDKNKAGGDGCSSSCTIEPGWSCKGVPSTCSPICGDGLVVGGEGCDDLNKQPGDGCFSCLVEKGWYCSGQPSKCATKCGDGIIAGLEECDDSNTAGGDGCSSACTVEMGTTVTSGGGGDTVTVSGAGGSTASGAGGAGGSGTGAGGVNGNALCGAGEDCSVLIAGRGCQCTLESRDTGEGRGEVWLGMALAAWAVRRRRQSAAG
jgi:MYXO-CTERM domain-containing protein